MAESKDTLNLTPRQTELLRAMVHCMKSKPDIDIEKFKTITNLANVSSAQRQINRILEILGAGAVKGKDGDTPKKKAASKKRKQAASDDNDDSEESPMKKAATEDGVHDVVKDEELKAEDDFFG